MKKRQPYLCCHRHTGLGLLGHCEWLGWSWSQLLSAGDKAQVVRIGLACFRCVGGVCLTYDANPSTVANSRQLEACEGVLATLPCLCRIAHFLPSTFTHHIFLHIIHTSHITHVTQSCISHSHRLQCTCLPSPGTCICMLVHTCSHTDTGIVTKDIWTHSLETFNLRNTKFYF